jgi:hypothetical protein
MEPALDHIAANQLKLWKVSIAIYCSHLEEVLGEIHSVDTLKNCGQSINW